MTPSKARNAAKVWPGTSGGVKAKKTRTKAPPSSKTKGKKKGYCEGERKAKKHPHDTETCSRLEGCLFETSGGKGLSSGISNEAREGVGEV